MEEYSLFERITQIFKLTTSSVFFMCLLVIIILTIVILVINSRMKTKIPKYLAAGTYFLIMVFIIVKYGSYFVSLQDSFIEKVFGAIYFPNLITYLSMLIITIYLLIRTFTNERYTTVTKIGNIGAFSFIWFLFVLILDTVKTNNIDIYDIKSIYSNDSLVMLLQSSTYLFLIWVGILLINVAVRKITAYLEKKTSIPTSNLNYNTTGYVYSNNYDYSKTYFVPNPNAMQKRDSYEVGTLSEADFNKGVELRNKQKKSHVYNEIIKHRDL